MTSSALFADLYELTMAATYFAEGKQDEIATFDLFVRRLPKERNYLVFAGLPAVIYFLENLHFSRSDINYLKSQKIFAGDFLDYLLNFKFRGDIESLQEGEIFFSKEPVMRVTGPLIEVQIIETALINIIQVHTMLASKAARILSQTKGKIMIDFGARRSHGFDSAMSAAYSSYLTGASGTSNVSAGKEYGIPVFGTMAHSFIQSFDKEEEAFIAFAKTFPGNTTLLIDTYNTVEGAKKVVQVSKKMSGQHINAVRIDSGDPVLLSREVRKILDQGGLKKTKIFVSGDLDEHKILEFENKKLPIDGYGVGTRMDVSLDYPFLDIVYKLSEVGTNPKMKFSPSKQNLPGKKQVVRVFSKGLAQKDIISLEDEELEGEPLLKSVIKTGKSLYKKAPWEELRSGFQNRVKQFPKELLLINSPFNYPVEISKNLAALLQKFTP